MEDHSLRGRGQGKLLLPVFASCWPFSYRALLLGLLLRPRASTHASSMHCTCIHTRARTCMQPIAHIAQSNVTVLWWDVCMLLSV